MDDNKTYKREVAVALLLFWAGFCVWSVFNDRAIPVLIMMTAYVFVFAGGAFSLDSLYKQFLISGDKE